MAGSPITNLDRALGQWVKTYRESCGFSQEAMVADLEACYVEHFVDDPWYTLPTQTTISKWEAGLRRVSSTDLMLLCWTYGLYPEAMVPECFQ